MEKSKHLQINKSSENSASPNRVTTKAKGTSLGRKEKDTTRNKKIKNGNAHWLHKPMVKVGNHPHTNMISKPGIMQTVEYRSRILEIHLKLRETSNFK